MATAAIVRLRPARARSPGFRIRPPMTDCPHPLPLPRPTPVERVEPVLTRTFLLLFLGNILQMGALFALLPVLPLLVVGPLGADGAVVGWVAGLASGTALLLRPFSGWLLDRFGRRPWLLATSALVTAVTFSYMFATSVPVLVAERILHGLAWSVCGISAATVAVDVVPASRRGWGLGLFGMGMPLAMSVGPLLGTWLLHGDRFSDVFLACGVASGLALACYVVADLPVVRNPGARLVLRDMLEPRVYRLFWFMLPLCVGYGGWAAFAPLYAPHVGLESAGPLFASYAVGCLLPRAIGGRWYDRAGPRVPGLFSLGAVLAGWLLLGVLQTEAGALAGAALVGLGFGVLMPVYSAMTADLVEPHRRGAANATTFSSYDLGSALGAVVFGLAVDDAHLHLIFVAAAVLTAGSLGTFAISVLPHFLRWRVRAA